MARRPKRPVTASRGVTFEQVSLAARAFPGVEVSTSYRTAALKVRGKLLARLHQNGDCFVLRASLMDREILMQATVEPGALPELIERAWRLVAPKALLAKYDIASRDC